MQEEKLDDAAVESFDAAEQAFAFDGSGASQSPVRLPSETFDLHVSKDLHAFALIFDRSQPLCIFFEAGERGVAPPGQTFSLKYGINAVIILSRDQDWFQYKDVEEAVAKVAALVSAFPRSVVCGCSQAGFASLIFSRELNVDAVVAYSPQSGMGPSAPVGERRWGDSWARIQSSPGFLRNDMAAGLTTSGDVIVTYDPLDLDRLHIRDLEKIRPISTIAIPFSGHATVQALASFGLSSALLLDVLAGSFDLARFRGDIRTARRTVSRVARLVGAMTARSKKVPDALLARLASEPHPIAYITLKRASAQAAERGLEAELIALLKRLLSEPANVARLPTGDLAKLIATIKTRDRAIDLANWLFELSGGYLTNDRAVAPLLAAAAELAHATGERQRSLDFCHLAGGRLAAWDARNADIAAVCAKLGFHNEARMYANRATFAGPTSVMSLRAISLFATTRDEQVEMAKLWKAAIDAGLDPLRAAGDYARLLTRVEDYAGALEALAPALALPEPAASLLALQGDILVKLGRPTEAIGAYQRALEASPNNVPAHRALSTLYGSRGQLDEAIHHGAKALALSPGNAGLKRNLEKLQALKKTSD